MCETMLLLLFGLIFILIITAYGMASHYLMLFLSSNPNHWFLIVWFILYTLFSGIALYILIFILIEDPNKGK